MTAPPPSPFADQPFNLAAESTESAIEEWLKVRKVSDTARQTNLAIKPWHYARVGGIPITTLIRRLWTSTRDGIRTNRYQLPARFYSILWLTLFASSLGLIAVGVPEGLEAAMDSQKNGLRGDYVGPACGALPRSRFYRIMARQLVNSLPLLVTLTIFFFPAVVRP
ncbi:hypothetical protein C7974DRAFT_408993 [Boeremia exigua]|uniref:uncharacterized protein n=1 Tax=Boeremia exigua TaxID=749465 RepID=UPI001E8D2EE0|nr:uncharacterized protein C7974DRAFT_408993 [Boeremia exigua]KAH6642434.1 hypothetical protein C7974DRAFT_408993 [Boeremia exigua]